MQRLNELVAKMCLEDVTVDTNVFAQTANPGYKFFDGCSRAVTALVDGQATLCVDQRGLMESEYQTWVPEQSLGRSALARLLASNRVLPVPSGLQPGDRRWLRQRVHDAGDRVFVAVALHSINRVLISNDESDFDDITRREVRERFDVAIVYTAEGADLLACPPVLA